jgi:predicted glutamine amidotransferase
MNGNVNKALTIAGQKLYPVCNCESTRVRSWSWSHQPLGLSSDRGKDLGDEIEAKRVLKALFCNGESQLCLRSCSSSR